MKPEGLVQLHKEIIARKEQLNPKWIKHIPNEPPAFEVKFNSMKKQQFDSIPANVTIKTLHKSLQKPTPITDRQQGSPVVLVFCQPAQQLGKPFPFVPVSYCSWLESAGARCVPLPYNINEGSMEYLLECTNGLLIPGGNSNLYRNYDTKEGYGEVTLGFKKVWRLVNKLWSKGIKYPIWGTCLGLELILLMLSQDTKVLSNLNSRNHAQQVWSDYDNSLIFRDMPIHIRVNLETQKLMNFFHMHGISVSRFLFSEKYQSLRDQLKLISASKDKDGTWFCSFLEGTKNPIFMSQFHPQKQAYEWNPTAVINHHYQAIEASQYFANQFVEQCRKCKNRFPNKQQQWYHFIYQYIPQFQQGKHFQIYLIDLKFRKNRDLKNPRVKKSKSELPAVTQSKKKIEEEPEPTYS